MTPDHQVRRNEAFSGLNSEDSACLSNYLHFRNVQTEEKKRALDEPTAPFNPRFLESAQDDQPKGCWSIQKDERKETTVVRSLMWPGYSFYHTSGTKNFGAMYIGDGLKNLELHFIVQ